MGRGAQWVLEWLSRNLKDKLLDRWGRRQNRPRPVWPQFLADRDHRDFEISSLSLLLLPLHEFEVYHLQPQRKLYLFSCPSLKLSHVLHPPISQARNPGVFDYSVFTCFLVALRWLLGRCQESSPHSLQLFLLRSLSKYLFSLCALKNTPLPSHFSKFIISNLI